MSSGWATGVGTGLLESVNSNIENQRALAQKNQSKGDEEQLEAFKQIQNLDATKKAQATMDDAKIDTMAKMLAANVNQPVGPWAYATARDAVDMGYTNPEHLPYVLDAAKRTFSDQQQNPDKWNVKDTVPKTFDQDSNPTQTATLRKLGNQTPVPALEDMRQSNITRAHNNLPGAAWGNPNDVANQETYNKKMVEQKAANAAGGDSGWGNIGMPGQGGSGGDMPPAHQEAVQQRLSQDMNLPAPPQGAQGGQSSLAVPASQLQPTAQAQQSPSQPSPQAAGGASAGIQLSGPAPQPTGSTMGQGPMQAPPSAAPPQPTSPAMTGQPFSYNAPTQLQGSRGQQVTGQQLHPEVLDQLSKTATPAQADLVRQIAEGTADIKTVIPGRGQQSERERSTLIAWVRAYDPSWDMKLADSRGKAVTELQNPDSDISRQSRAAVKLINHMDDMDKNLDSMNLSHPMGSGDFSSTPVSPLPGLSNTLHRGTAVLGGGPELDAIRRHDQFAQGIATEQGNFFNPKSGGTEKDRDKNASPYTVSGNTPESIRSSLGALAILMKGQLDPIQRTRDDTLGLHSKDVLPPETKAALDRLMQYGQPGAKTPATIPGHEANSGSPMRINPQTGQKEIWVGPGEPN